MSKIASILACCVLASTFSLAAQALPGSPVSVQIAASQVTLVKNFCGRGFHRNRFDACVPYAGPQAFGLPYVELPSVRLPYVEPPAVRLPYVEPPMVGLPYVELPVLGVPHMCPYGYSYYAPHGRCVPI